MKKIAYLVLFLIKLNTLYANTPIYRVATKPWREQLGNHRAVIKIDKFAHAVQVTLDWRRHDKDVAGKCLLITDANGQKVENIFRTDINRESGTFIFQPINNQLVYYVYYLPWQGKKEIGYFGGNYLKPEPKPDQEWVNKNRLLEKSIKLPRAIFVAFESRTAFDSFYPMEIIATQKEVNALKQKVNKPFLLFPENRRNPIRMTDDLPAKWIKSLPASIFKDEAKRNEYYVFQLGLFASEEDVKNLQIFYKGNKFPITCFNVEGKDSKGIFFSRRVDVAKNKIQALWFGVDIPANAPVGVSTFTLTVKPQNAAAQNITVQLNVLPQLLKDRGDSELWRHSRLRWLNSTLGINDEVISPYKGLEVYGQKINSLTSTVLLKDDGFPNAIEVNGKNILQTPLSFTIETDKGTEALKSNALKFLQQSAGKVKWQSNAINSNFEVKNSATMEFDGYMRYSVVVKSLANQFVKDIRLVIPVQKELASYFMGMGLPGMKCPETYNWKWKGPQDSYWIGNASAGIFCEMRGTTYSGPLLNLYHPAPPHSWYNNNSGGFNITTDKDAVVAKTFSGERQFTKGDSMKFEFVLLVTPVKKIDPKTQFTNRYYHNGNVPEPPLRVLESGVKIINVHHANPVNPYINYPFISADSIKSFAKRWHQKGVKTKIYYTIRELTNQTPELWALRSLGNEILADGNGGGYTWLREHLGNNYNVQWFTPINNTDANDAAILTSGESRWYNYYIEGLRWMVKNTDIDGLYLDDVAFDRDMLKRMRRVMEMVKPGCIIDLHSNTGFSKGPVTQYMEFFPFLDKLWFGESFQYDKMAPENWLVEVSGIPYGLMGDMLHAGGNPWRGMVYGMTVRYPWFTEGVNCDPREIWKIWDEFGIADAKMIGYWQDDKVISTSSPDVLATAYVKDNRMLIAVASWAKTTLSITLNIDWKKLGWRPQQEVLTAKGIPNFQNQETFKLTDKITIEPTKGYLLEIK
jgi:hypothetical protein